MKLTKRKLVARNNRNLIVDSHPDSLIAEQFQTIQSNISLLTPDEGNQVLLITSPLKEEGKTTTAVNLAITLASQKRKVLLIDSNLRKPSTHMIFKIPNKVGLTNVLLGKSSLKEAVTQTEISKLDVLPSGPTPVNPVELLNSKGMSELLTNARQIYEIVVIDSPSVLEVTDAKLIANHCDGVILVVNRGKTQLENAREARKKLEFAKAKIIGVILNK